MNFHDELLFILLSGGLTIGAIIAIGWAITATVKAICKTVTINTKIKYFGSSQEYEDFKKWKKEQVADMAELNKEPRKENV